MSLAKTSRISVVIPHYNHGSLLPEAIDSCLKQSLPPGEIIIVDDASDQNDRSIAQQLAATHSTVRLIQNKKNIGVVKSINTGLEAAKGEYIVFRAADDISLPLSFESSQKALSDHPQAGVCFGDVRYFSKTPSAGQIESVALSKTPIFFPPNKLAAALTSQHFLSGASAMVRTSAIKAEGGQHEDLKWYADWYCFLTIAFRHGACYVPIPTTAFRLNAESYGNAGTRNTKAKNKTLRNILQRLNQDDPQILQRFIESGSFQLFDNSTLLKMIEELDFLNAAHKKSIRKTAEESPEQIIEAAKKNIALPGVIRRQLLQNKQKIVSKTQSKNGRIYLYGAGKHTEILLQIWNFEKLPPIHRIVESTQPACPFMHKIPKVSIEDIDPNENDLIILSSKSYESAFINTCHNNWPQTTTITFWIID